ncbi:MAG: hypothetical protein Q4P13_06450, partial [Psychrobacter sp.]|nr:hypothetical protein [Psychrobacter sp.]
MTQNKRFGISSAYGQLIVLVFLPILVLALVGGALVFFESMRASKSEQQIQAQAVLSRFKPIFSEDLEQLSQVQQALTEQSANLPSTNHSAPASWIDIDNAALQDDLSEPVIAPVIEEDNSQNSLNNSNIPNIPNNSNLS